MSRNLRPEASNRELYLVEAIREIRLDLELRADFDTNGFSVLPISGHVLENIDKILEVYGES